MTRQHRGHRSGRLAWALAVLAIGTACTDATNPTPVDPAAETLPWPTQEGVASADGVGAFGDNLSDLAYEGASPGVIWAVRNGPGMLFRLVWNGTIWTPQPGAEWGGGKALRYPGGHGEPDAEGVTFAGTSALNGIYVAAERNNEAKTVSRNSILRYDVSANGTTLDAVNEWDLTADLLTVDPNLGLEGITWIPDSWLVAQGFMDRVAGHLYLPSEHPHHGDGLFLVSVENTGEIVVYSLNHNTNEARRVASFASGLPQVMALWFDRDLGYLWAHCDNNCEGKSSILEVDIRSSTVTPGQFRVTRFLTRPTTLGNMNTEGFTMAPLSACVGGVREAYWADDGNTGNHALLRGSVSCARWP